MDGYKHYVRVKGGLVVYRFSSAFEEPQEGDICVNEDGGRHYNEPVMNARGQYLFRWVDGEEVARTQDELDDELANQPPAPPTAEERLASLEAATLAMMEAMMSV